MSDYEFDFTLEDMTPEQAEQFLLDVMKLAKRRHVKFGGGGCHKVDPDTGECLDEQEPGQPAQ